MAGRRKWRSLSDTIETIPDCFGARQQMKERPVVRLDLFSAASFDRGRSRLVEALWIVMQALFVSSVVPGSVHRRFLLRAFGAVIGKGIVVKTGVRIKFPWRLVVGDHSWIGEGAWIDNLAEVRIGAHCCISQGAYLCTGSHDWTKSQFDLIVRPIVIGDGAWIGANTSVAPGTVVGEGAVLTMGSVARGLLEPRRIYRGNPAVAVASR